MNVVLDTNVYFAILADADFLDVHGPWLRAIAPRMYLSSVVLAELIQGARGDLARRRMRRAVSTLERVGRVVAPTHDDWTRAASIQGRVWDRDRSLRTKDLLHDALIGQSAIRIGAVVVTENVRDFALISKHAPVRAMTVIEAAARFAG